MRHYIERNLWRRLAKIGPALAGALATAAGLLPQASNAQYTANCIPASSPVRQGMISWWPGDGNANDIHGANPGTLHGLASFATGMVQPAFRFNGVSNGQTTPEVLIAKPAGSSLNLGSSDFTIDAWVRLEFGPSSVPRNDRAVFQTYAGVPQYGLFVTYRNKAAFSFRPSAPSLNGNLHDPIGRAVGVTELKQGVWYFLTGVRRGDRASIFVNAVLEGTGSEAPYLNNGIIDTSQCAYARIGGTNTGAGHCTSPNVNLAEPQFRGRIDEVEIFNRALPRTQIDALYLAHGAGKCKP